MKRFKTVYTVFFLLFTASMFFNFSSNPPNGRTGAPGEGTCSGCHSQNAGFDGNISITGFPGTVQPNTNYPLTLTVTATMGNPVRAGFQLVALDGNDNNIGTLTALGASTTQSSGGRTYVEHNPAQSMSGNAVTYNFEWDSPSSAGGDEVTLYSAALMGNGSGSGNDKTLLTSLTSNFPSANPPTVDITGFNNVSCNGGNDGDATAVGSGGTPPLTYSWSNGGAGTFVSGLSAGPITVTVTDDNGMTDTDQVTISEPSVLNISITNQTDIDCINLDGSATAAGSGGVGNYSYAWDNGETGATATNLPFGVTDVTVTDGNNCTTTTFVDILEDINPPTAVAGSATITCAPDINLDGTGSSTGSNFSYLWTAPNGSIISGANSLTAVATGFDPFILEVTDNSNGCTTTDQATIFQDDTPPTADAGTDEVLDCTTTQVTLGGNGTSTGSNISYQWTTTNGNIVSGATTENALVNMAGIYTLEVTDNQNSCFATDDVVVTLNMGNLIADAGFDDVLTCAVTQVQLDGSNSSSGSNITYQWTTSNGNIVSGVNTLTPTVDQIGDYTLTVFDSNTGCSMMDMVNISGDFTAPIVAVSSSGAITCINSTVTLDGTGSSAGIDFSYLWSTSNGNIVSGATTLTSVVDAAGEYELTVTNNNNGCTAISSITVMEDLTVPTASAGSDQELNCNITSIQLQGSGSMGGQFSINWTTTNGNITMGANSYTPTVDAAGTYILNVTDSNNGCSASSMVEVISVANPMAGVTNVIAVSCFGENDGAATATVTMGEAPFSYAWSNGTTGMTVNNLSAGNNSLTVTDNNGCTSIANFMVSTPSEIMANITATGITANGANDGTASATPTGGTPPYAFAWSTGANTPTISGLSPGSYNVTVFDSNNCTVIGTTTVNGFNCSLTGDFSATAVSCFGGNDGTATANPMGGVAPYSYSWNTGGTTATISNLIAGTYSCTISDAANCVVSGSVTVAEPTELMTSFTKTDVSCFGGNDGSIILNTSGGTLPYSYSWIGGNNPSAMGLAAGDYFPTITDANGCFSTPTITINEPSDIVINLSMTNETGNMTNDGSGAAMVSGGTQPYSYAWSNGANTPTIAPLSAGDYSVTVTDANGCEKTATGTVQSFTCAGVAANVDDTNTYICPGSSSGSLMVIDFSGGTAPYNFVWSTGATTNTIENLPGGTYTISGSDADGCTFSQNYLVTEEDTIAPILVTTPLTIFLDASGNASFDPASLNAGSTDNCGGIDSIYVDISSFGCADVGNNTIQVVIFDENGNCADAPETITVMDTIAPVITCPDNISTMDCSAITYPLPTLSDNCSMNILPDLQNGFSSGSVFPVGMTTVTYSGTDASGNTVSCSFNVELINDLAVAADIETYNCDGTATLETNFSGGTAPYTASWSPGNPNAPIIVTDTFSISIIDANGCMVALDSIFSIPDSIQITVDSIVDGGVTIGGSAFVSVAGGALPLTYTWTDEFGNVVSTEQDLTDGCGVFVLETTDANGCAQSTTVQIGCLTSVQDSELNEFVELFPNPTGGNFQIELNLPSSMRAGGENVSVQFYNLDGKLIEQTEPTTFQKSVLKFENKNWSSGMYLVKILVGEAVLVKRLMIE